MLKLAWLEIPLQAEARLTDYRTPSTTQHLMENVMMLALSI